MIVFDHTNKRWLKRHRRTNGALTYSQDIVKYQLENWKTVLGEGDELSTCPHLAATGFQGRCGTVVQYLHEFPTVDPIGYLKRAVAGVRAARIVFVTAYKAYHRLMLKHGYESVFVPMSIDVDSVRQYGQEASIDRVLWFGNVTPGKRSVYRRAAADLEMDTISRSMFAGRPISQTEAWGTASAYRYGVAVGRCALELFALGLKVLIAGRGIGGIAMDEDDWQAQIDTNFNARVATFSRDLRECFRALPASYVGKIPDIRTMNHAQLI